MLKSLEWSYPILMHSVKCQAGGEDKVGETHAKGTCKPRDFS